MDDSLRFGHARRARPWGFLLVAALLGLAASPPAQATHWGNQFVEFELPYNWKCLLEGADWVCQSEDSSRKREAIIVLAAKLKGDQDSMDKYREYLKKPRAFSSPAGRPVISQSKYVAEKQLNGQLWEDSLHLESEIPGFFTRYLATVFQDIGVLVTYSVDKSKYQDYAKQFDDLVGSLKVFHRGPLNQREDLFTQVHRVTPEAIFPNQTDHETGRPVEQPLPVKDAAAGGVGLLILLLIGAGTFLLWKRRKSAS